MNKVKLFFTAAIAILLVMGCNLGVTQDDVNLSQVNISLNGNFRTILPDLGIEKFSKIEISAESITGTDSIDPVEVDLVTGTASLTVPYGSWNIIATAFLKVGETDYPAVSDSVQLYVTQPSHDVTILLDTPTPDGIGTFAYNIEFAVGTEVSITLENWPSDNGYELENETVTASGTTFSKDVPSGFYFLTVTAIVDGKPYERSQIVHIYHGRTSTAEFSFLYIEQILAEGTTVVHYYPTMEISPGYTHNTWDGEQNPDGGFKITTGGIRYSFSAITDAGYNLDDYDFVYIYYTASDVDYVVYKQFDSGLNYPTHLYSSIDNGSSAYIHALSASTSNGFAIQKYSGTEAMTIRIDKLLFIQGDRGTLTLNSNGADNADDIDGSFTFVLDISLNLPTPIKDGLLFMGWKNDDGEIISNNTIATEDMKNITLTAQWEEALELSPIFFDFTEVDFIEDRAEVIEFDTDSYTININSWHGHVKYEITLPEGATLAHYDYVLFTIEDISGDSTYKQGNFIAGKPIPENDYYYADTHGVTTWNTEDFFITSGIVYHTLTIDKSKAGDLSGTIQVAVHIHAPPNASYRISNLVILQEKDLEIPDPPDPGQPGDPTLVTDNDSYVFTLASFFQDSDWDVIKPTKSVDVINGGINIVNRTQDWHGLDINIENLGLDIVNRIYEIRVAGHVFGTPPDNDFMLLGEGASEYNWLDNQSVSAEDESFSLSYTIPAHYLTHGHNIETETPQDRIRIKANSTTMPFRVTSIIIEDKGPRPVSNEDSTVNVSVTDAFASNSNIKLTWNESVERGEIFEATISFETTPNATITYTWRINGSTVGTESSLTYSTTDLTNKVNYGTVIVTINGTPYAQSFEFKVN